MKTLISTCFFLLGVAVSFSQTFNPFYSDIVNNVSETNLLNDLTTYTNFGVKEVGTSNLTDSQNWIVNRYQTLGYTDIVLQPFTYAKGTSNNIIVTKTGTLYPNTYLIIDGHYDSMNGVGANDNGSGTVLLLELARLLKDVDTEYSIKFIHFSGEEDGLIGSNYYVNNTVIPEALDIRLVFNIDEVGGLAGANNDTIVCERDQTAPQTNNAASNAFTQSLAVLMELYSNLNTEISHAYSSDYMPFEDHGEIITGLFEKNETPYAHSPNDVIARMDMPYLYQVTKGALGAALEFAIAYDVSSTEDDETLKNSIQLATNTTNDVLNISFSMALEEPVSFKLIDMLGKNIIEKSLTKQQQSIPIDSIQTGTYFAIFNLNNKRIIKDLLIK